PRRTKDRTGGRRGASASANPRRCAGGSGASATRWFAEDETVGDPLGPDTPLLASPLGGERNDGDREFAEEKARGEQDGGRCDLRAIAGVPEGAGETRCLLQARTRP